MGVMSEDLFQRLIDDAKVRPDRPDVQNEPEHEWSDGSLVRNEDFKNIVFDLLMRRAKHFYKEKGIKNRPEGEKYVYVPFELVIYDDTIHPEGEKEVDFSQFKDWDDKPVADYATFLNERIGIAPHKHDSDEINTWRIEINKIIALGCGPDLKD